MLQDRIRSACMVLAGLLGLLFLDSLFNTTVLSSLLVAGALIAGLWEMTTMARKRGIDIHFKSTALFIFLWVWTIPTMYTIPSCSYNREGYLFLFFVVIVVLQVRRLGNRDEDVIASLGATVLSFAYLALAGSYLYKMRVFGVTGPESQMVGIRHLLYFMVVVKSTDIGAYFTGREFGATKLIERLSPGKTVEGLIGGVALAMVVSLLLSWVLDIGSIGFFGALFFGLIMGLLGQAADLFESLLKRSAGVKDSGGTIPGMGGVLDVLDSLILTAPVAYWMLLVLS